MIAAFHGYVKDLSMEFYHDPLVKNKYGCTVAMIATYNGRIKDLPWEFYHSSLVMDYDGENMIDMLVGQ